MCCCPEPNVNGQTGYRWHPNEPDRVRPLAPPELADGELMIFDEPGRCGGLDAHSHHFRVVQSFGTASLVWRHGGGTGRVRLSGGRMVIAALQTLDSAARYWLLHAMYYTHADGASHAQEATDSYWRRAAAEKRIKISRSRDRVTVTVK